MHWYRVNVNHRGRRAGQLIALTDFEETELDSLLRVKFLTPVEEDVAPAPDPSPLTPGEHVVSGEVEDW